MAPPWTLQFLRDYASVVSIGSLVEFRRILIRERAENVPYDEEAKLRLRRPYRSSVTIRPSSNDIYTFREIFVDNIYGKIFGHLERVETVVDLGANIGLASMYLAGHYPGARFVCVEPDPRNVKLLKSNLHSLVQAGRAEIIQGAVWGRAGEVALSESETGHFNQRTCRDRQEGETGETVLSYTILDILKKTNLVNTDLLKIDIEGAEVELFSHEPIWLNRVGGIAIEFHGDSRQQTGFDRHMIQYGFRIVEESGHTVIAIAMRSLVSSVPC